MPLYNKTKQTKRIKQNIKLGTLEVRQKFQELKIILVKADQLSIVLWKDKN